MRPYLLVTGDLVATGGMDAANLALAAHLAGTGREVHLVTHRLDDALAEMPGVTSYQVPKPLDSYLLGTPLLGWAGRYRAGRLADRAVIGVANGGSFPVGSVNWLHYIHAAYPTTTPSRGVRRVAARAASRRFRVDERRAVGRAAVVIANSRRTAQDAVERLGVAADRVHTVYYGTAPDGLRPPTPLERESVRSAMGWTGPTVAFIGALGDRRKGFDTLFDAWRRLCADPDWDVTLVVIGTGAELPAWRARTGAAGLDGRIRFLGFRDDVRDLLAGVDLLVAPSRYEPYGLAAHEALCRGVPAIVTRDAGVAERIQGSARDLLLNNPDDADALADRLTDWRSGRERHAGAVQDTSRELRSWSWRDMAERMVEIMECHS